MRDDLLQYYERELTYLRRMGAEFAERYPKVASRLLLEPSKCEDPHVERLLEGVAFLAARVHLKLDDDFPELSESLLDVAYPQYVRPIPSMSVVELQLDPEQGKLTSGLRIPRGSMLYSRPVDGVPCKFQSCYDTTLWPLTLAGVRWTSPDRLSPAVRASDAVAALRLELKCLPDVRFPALELSSLRVHLNGESNLVYTLYELLCNNCGRIMVREPGRGAAARTLTLPPTALRPVGFADDEGMLPHPRRSFLAYRLLQEYFGFPAKFLFFDLDIFDAVRAAGFGDAVEVIILISPFERADRREMLETGINDRALRLGCTPIVNLFPQASEPVLLSAQRHEHPIVADARRRATTQIYSIDEITGVASASARAVRFEPLYAHRHRSDGAGNGTHVYWHASRRASGWRTDGGTDTHLALVDLSGSPVHPELEAITARLTCFNGDLPSRLPFGNDDGDFELQGGGPIRRIVALLKPTPVVHPPLGRSQLWRLISQLSLNHLSLVDEGPSPLQEILRLHNFADSMAAERQIQGITAVRSERCYARVNTEQGLTFARGRRIEIELNEEQFTGGGVFLFASVLEHFLGLYASINSFSILQARTRQRKEPLREWAPRSGWRPLL
ncbi:MAG TPA: type VI secretion system baseplate subunit TssF [Gemmatimonadaceae bacterium]|nr:type VI secretion system baseplate subunit TssF [Gemmatimonadaceae bacterium]